MKSSIVAWGIVLLIVFAAAHWLVSTGIPAAWLWVAVAIIILIMNFIVGRTFKKKMQEELWLILGVFGFITTLAVAAQVVPVDFSWLMALWLLLIGGALAVGGNKSGNVLDTYSGLIMLFAALLVPTFGAAYFLSGALFLGFLGVVHGYFYRE